MFRKSIFAVVITTFAVTMSFGAFSMQVAGTRKAAAKLGNFKRPRANKLDLHHLRSADPVRQLELASYAGNLKQIISKKAYARYWFPNGKSALTGIDFAPLHLQKPAAEALLSAGAVPLMMDLRTFELAIENKFVREAMVWPAGKDFKETLLESGLALTLGTFFLRTSIASLLRDERVTSLSSALLVGYPSNGLIKSFTEFHDGIARKLEQQFNSKALSAEDLNKMAVDQGLTAFPAVMNQEAFDMLARFFVAECLHNTIAATVALLAPLVWQDEIPLSRELRPILNASSLTIRAKLLLSIMGIHYSEDEQNNAKTIESAHVVAKKMAPLIIVRVAKLIRALMAHEKIKLFAHKPEFAYLYLLDNFNRIGELPYPKAHAAAHKIIYHYIEDLSAKEEEARRIFDE